MEYNYVKTAKFQHVLTYKFTGNYKVGFNKLADIRKQNKDFLLKEFGQSGNEWYITYSYELLGRKVSFEDFEYNYFNNNWEDTTFVTNYRFKNKNDAMMFKLVTDDKNN